jgi:creatinine amidohydrolase
MVTTTKESVRWADLLPEEFHNRLQAVPVVYLPLGLCEPHGHIAAFGLDTHKADYLCDEAARRFGGIVAPTQGYHVHETGYHAPWLKQVMGAVNPRLGALPPDVIYRTFLFQLRAFVNAGFRLVIAISGHHGGNQVDLRLVAREFCADYPITVHVHSDPELVEGQFPGDHAGRYEISQLLYLRPDLVDLSRVQRVVSDPLGRFAQGTDAAEATADYGRQIIEASLARIGKWVADFLADSKVDDVPFIEFGALDPIWERIAAQSDNWRTLKL